MPTKPFIAIKMYKYIIYNIRFYSFYKTRAHTSMIFSSLLYLAVARFKMYYKASRL